MQQPIPSNENWVNNYSLVPQNDQSAVVPGVRELYNKETIDRQNEESERSMVPERFKNPTDVSHQKRYIEEKKCHKGTRKCYTCFPKRLAVEHTIKIDNENSTKFHFDMCNRPLIIATPFKHIKTIQDFENPVEMSNFFKSIAFFCDFWNIKDYQIQINHGEWQHHDHLHAKIKGNEDVIHKLRQDHFKLLKLQKSRAEERGS